MNHNNIMTKTQSIIPKFPTGSIPTKSKLLFNIFLHHRSQGVFVFMCENEPNFMSFSKEV